MKNIVVNLIVIIILISPLTAYADWSEPVQLTDGLGLLNPIAVAVDETLHVVGQGYGDTHYLRSTDNGATWTDPVIPPDTFYSSNMPYITSSNSNNIHITFIGDSDISQPLQAYHMSSSDGGRNWSAPHQIFQSQQPPYLKSPSLVAKGDTLFFVCMYNNNLLTLRSFNNGVTWQDSIIAEGAIGAINQSPILLYSNERLHVVYPLGILNDSIGYEIYHRFSDDYGLTWSDRRYLSTPEPLPYVKHSQSPSASIDENGNIIAAWYDYKYGSYCGFTGDILARISTDNGNTWLPESRLTYTQSGSRSSSVILDNKIYMVWMDHFPYGCSCPKIMYSESDDWGATWETPIVISGTTATDEYSPVLIYNFDQTTPVFHCFMRKDTSPTTCDLFYFRSEEFVSIEFDDKEILPDDLDITAYPNPFNSSLSITFNSKESGILQIYDILGCLVQEYKYQSGVIRLEWDACDFEGKQVSSGVYFIKQKGEYSKPTAQRVIYLR